MRVSLSAFVHYFNTPIVKETTKKFFGGITLAFGIIELYDDIKECYMHLRSRITHKGPIYAWQCTAYKTLLLISKISLYTSALSTKPAALACSWVASRLFSSEQLSRYFGPNLNFASNPYHPRHVISILSFLLGIPAMLKTFYDLAVWIKTKICCSKNSPTPQPNEEADERRLMTSTKVIRAAWLNTLISRPMVHGANAFFRCMLMR